jgi:hypothetical protein
MRIDTHRLNSQFGRTTVDTSRNLSTVGRHEFLKGNFTRVDSGSRNHSRVVRTDVGMESLLLQNGARRSPTRRRSRQALGGTVQRTGTNIVVSGGTSRDLTLGTLSDSVAKHDARCERESRNRSRCKVLFYSVVVGGWGLDLSVLFFMNSWWPLDGVVPWYPTRH